MTDPTQHEIEACSDCPARFRRMHATAIEVIDHASSHGGRLPSFVYGLSASKWNDLSVTLREIDLIHWARGMAA